MTDTTNDTSTYEAGLDAGKQDKINSVGFWDREEKYGGQVITPEFVTGYWDGYNLV